MIPEARLCEHLERVLASAVIAFDQRPSACRTSSPLHEVDVELADGRRIEAMAKELGREALTPEARAAKPVLLDSAGREVEVYERVLRDAGLGTAAYYGVVATSRQARRWLLVERVRGVELHQVGSLSTWQFAARGLAAIHVRLADQAQRVGRLLRHDAELMHFWPRRAASFATAEHDALARIADGYDVVVRRLLALPTTVVHGDFYASNVLVDDPEHPSRVCPVDWELAGVGPGLLDLAALVSGDWTAEKRSALATAYRDALPSQLRPAPADFSEALDACRLHVALQWLGWSQSWSPPPEHVNDWLGDALALARRLGVL